jgi:UDP-N-acetylmuramyl-tripeptide synthetase
MNGCEGVSFFYRTAKGDFPVSVPIPGTFTVQNALLALTAAKTLGVGVESGIRSLARVPTVPGRMERVDTDGFPFSVFIDYAHTEAALRSLLTSVRAIRRPGERIVVLFGCGGDRDPSKRCEMGKAASELADLSIVTSDNSRSEDPKKIILSILSGMGDASCRRVIVDREKAIRYAIENAKPGDILLLVGKGHEKYEIRSDGVREFDEKKIVLDALEALRAGHTIGESKDADQNRNAD